MGKGHRGAEVWGKDTEELRYGERTQRRAEVWGEDTERS